MVENIPPAILSGALSDMMPKRDPSCPEKWEGGELLAAECEDIHPSGLCLAHAAASKQGKQVSDIWLCTPEIFKSYISNSLKSCRPLCAVDIDLNIPVSLVNFNGDLIDAVLSFYIGAYIKSFSISRCHLDKLSRFWSLTF